MKQIAIESHAMTALSVEEDVQYARILASTHQSYKLHDTLKGVYCV